MARSELFPPIEPYETGLLKVDPIHTLYWEQCGNPAGVPVVFLHGGPGAGASPAHRRFFDPAHYRIVILDQRGAGRSTPLGETRANTIWDLVADLERLRTHLGIGRWHVFGGSWGSTLALAYAQTHPDRVIGLIVRGIFLMRRMEIDWFLHGARMVFPDAWERFAGFLPPEERGDLLEGYWRRLNDPDPAVQAEAAKIWSIYEGTCSTLLPNPDMVAASGEDVLALGLARLEAHYFRNNLFDPDDLLLRNVDRIRRTPGIIIQGRYDVVCPAISAWELHRRWPEAEFQMVPDAGHAAMDPGIRAALVAATERFKVLRP
ncbi:MAG TPA: prolyl aminopeptidase [Azospirillaceae bacterium]|nr:prolyl aminopeptidase [Azospirillaceae bacterium]